jgi:hypothetical protein
MAERASRHFCFVVSSKNIASCRPMLYRAVSIIVAAVERMPHACAMKQ